MTFRNAVQESPDLRGAWRPGLGALGTDSRHVAANDPRTIAGSVHIEECLKKSRKTERRWDYAVGHKPSNRGTEVVYWIEVHPAYDHEIKVVKEKLNSLHNWLRTSAPRLNEMDSDFVWVASGDTSFTKGSKQVRRLAEEGLSFHGGVPKLTDQFEEP